MRALIIGLVVTLLLACTSLALAKDVRVKGYVKKDGTYVAPHYRSQPDGKFHNNWSTKGNINPYTGREGTRITPPGNFGQRPGVGVSGNYHYDSQR